MNTKNELSEDISHMYEDEKEADFIHNIDHDGEGLATDDENSPELKAAEKSLLRKLDFIHVMPCIAILNFLQVYMLLES